MWIKKNKTGVESWINSNFYSRISIFIGNKILKGSIPKFLTMDISGQWFYCSFYTFSNLLPWAHIIFITKPRIVDIAMHTLWWLWLQIWPLWRAGTMEWPGYETERVKQRPLQVLDCSHWYMRGSQMSVQRKDFFRESWSKFHKCLHSILQA